MLRKLLTALALTCAFVYFGSTVGRAQTTPLSDLDALRYIASHPDLIAAFGTDAAKGRSHYEQWGIKEGRTITFEPLNYTASYSDLIGIIGVDETKAVIHYIESGFKEKRAVSFDPFRYLALHADLRAAFGSNLKEAARHYILYGSKEGRVTTGPYPILQSKLASLSFEDQLVSPTRTVTVTNGGTSDLLLSAISIEGADASQFSQSSDCASVKAAGTCEIRVTFKPVGFGLKNASLKLVSNAVGSPHVISVSGLVRSMSDLESLRYIASHPDLIAAFGTDLAKGRSHYEQYGLKEGRTITFEPLYYIASHPDLMAAFGTDETKAVTHYIESGFKEKRQTTFTALDALRYIASHADLIQAFGPDGNKGLIHYIQWGYKEGRKITFDPGVYLTIHADVKALVKDNLEEATKHYISVGFKEGRAVSGTLKIQVDTTTLTFASQTVGSVSQSQTVTVTNTGSIPLTVSAVALSGASADQFAQTNNCSSVAVGATCAITVTFKPTSTGSKSASISITHNASGSPTAVALSGTGASLGSAAVASDLDALRYIASHADLIAAFGADPVKGREHYDAWGAREGRQITFDPLRYIASHSDLIAAFGTDELKAVTHYIQNGFKERRSITFDPSAYLSLHADLRAAFGTDTTAATKHYIQFGYKEGRATVGTPSIQLSSSRPAFGSQTVNTTSAAQTITVSNAGTATLTISGVSLSGTDAGQFAQSNNCSSVAAGSSCTISVTFSPTSTGSKSGSISISHNASGSPTTVSLTGSGTAAPTPAISVSPTSLSFSQTVNTTSAAQTITVSNAGTATLTISGVSLSGTDAGQFAQSNNCSSVAAGSSCTISVTFSPTSTGSKSGSISISHNASGSPTTVSLTGSGTAAPTPAISVSPTSLSFSQTVNTTSAAQTITVSNAGTATLTISGVSLSGTDAGQFAQSNNCSSVAAGSSCTISVTFSPTSTGSKSGSISISHNASGSPTTVSLTGSGVGSAVISITPNSVDFGYQTLNVSSPVREVRIVNAGSAVLLVNGISVTGRDDYAFSQTNNCVSILPNEFCTVFVSFRSSSLGDQKSATLNVSSNSAGGLVSVGLVGKGGYPKISLSTSLLQFSEQAINTESSEKKVNIVNDGTVDLVITGINLGGNQPTAFAQTNNCQIVAPAKSCSVNVKFKPDSVGNKSAKLLIYHQPSEGSVSPTTVDLSGAVAPLSVSQGFNLNVSETYDQALGGARIGDSIQFHVEYDPDTPAVGAGRYKMKFIRIIAGSLDLTFTNSSASAGVGNYAEVKIGTDDGRKTVYFEALQSGYSATLYFYGGNDVSISGTSLPRAPLKISEFLLGSSKPSKYGSHDFQLRLSNGTLFVGTLRAIVQSNVTASNNVFTIYGQGDLRYQSIPPEFLEVRKIGGSDSAKSEKKWVDANQDQTRSKVTMSSGAGLLLSSQVDPLTGSIYRVTRKTGEGGGNSQQWTLEYRSNTGAVFASRTLPSTSEVLWRERRENTHLSTTAWTRVCADRVWTVQDGYELLFHVGDRGLQDLRPGQLSVNSSAETTVVTDVRCAFGGALWVEGYALGVSGDEPPLRSNQVAATRFGFVLDRFGGLMKREVQSAPFDVTGLCAAAANEQQMFCEDVKRAVGW